jgi:hypothetical protein
MVLELLVIVFAVVDDSLPRSSPLGDTVESFCGARMPSVPLNRSAATAPNSPRTVGSRSTSLRQEDETSAVATSAPSSCR